MKDREIADNMNALLHETAAALADWLEEKLPRVADTWWEDCVLSSLSCAQRELAASKGYSKLSDLDLAALLRITNKSWYELRTVLYLSSSEREIMREMMGVRNNWVHCGAEVPGKDTIIHDLNTLSALAAQIGGSPSIRGRITALTAEIESSDRAPARLGETGSHCGEEQGGLLEQSDAIKVNGLVYLTGSPETKGIVVHITDLGGIKKYDVFADNAVRSYYTGQIAPVVEDSGYHWVSLDTVRSYLTAYQINQPSSQSLYSLNSARIDFVPYQFRPALKLIHADEPRILIADSVGVGKTIEAGLIIKELEARSELERIAVICPRPLVAERKWELEMKRFDEEFVPVDGPALRQILSDTDRDGEWPARYNKVILPYSILDSKVYLGGGQKRERYFGLSELDPEPRFDLVIVDEAHHIRKGSMDKEKAFAYKCTKYFCDHADAVVMLTATPLQTGDDDLYTLLNVLRPDVVLDQKTFAMMSRPNEHISKAIHIIRAAEDSWEGTAARALAGVKKTQWGEDVIARNPLYADVLGRLGRERISREERIRLISDIESLHSFSTMINRTRRRDIQDFCVRRSHTISTEFTQYQRSLHDELLAFERSALSRLHDTRAVPFMMSTVKRQAASCIFGLAPSIRDVLERRLQQLNDDPESDFSEFDLDGGAADTIFLLAQRVLVLAERMPEEDPKFEAALRIIAQKQELTNNKIMLFSTFRHTLAYLKRKLSALGYRVGQVDGSVKDEQRYALKSRFELPKENPEAVDILLFTEVGSEGLDYQFCDTMINYDLPWNPMRIEQRIGRIDRRGQQSEAVNIYNMITEGTVDADIYYRCLLRIGVFEKSIGDCEEILGEIASGIGSVVLDTTLTEGERRVKLEQVADNEVRKIQAAAMLEEAEKELFGFDLTEFTTVQEIRRAENPWLTPKCLQRLVVRYLDERVGAAAHLIGEAPLKNLRLSASARGILRDDLRKLPGGRNALRRTWENYLAGRNPNHPVTFDPDTAAKHRDSFFITAMHPLAKQAARFFAGHEGACLRIQYTSADIPAGTYLFSIFAWNYTGFHSRTRLIPVCENEVIVAELPDILDAAEDLRGGQDAGDRYNWSELDARHAQMWKEAKQGHQREVAAMTAFKLESLANSRRNCVRSLEQQISDALDDSIRRMRMGELETAKVSYDRKMEAIQEAASKAELYATRLVNGVITVMGG